MTTIVDRSWYEDSVRRPPVRRLEGDIEAEVLIVGGGYAGLGCALSMAERGQTDVVVIEAERFGHGASGRNGGFVFAGYSRDEQRLIQELGSREAAALWQLTRSRGIELVRRRIAEHAIACDTVEGGVLWTNWFSDPTPLLQRRQRVAEHYGLDWPLLDQAALQAEVRSPRYGGALLEPDAFHVHPLKLVLGEVEVMRRLGVQAYEASSLVSLEPQRDLWRAQTAGGQVRARRVVLAMGGYGRGAVARVERAVQPVATWMCATEPLGSALDDVFPGSAAVYDTRFAFDYFHKSADRRLLWGGGISVRTPPLAEVATILSRDIGRVFPGLDKVRLTHVWSGLMSYARHQMPQLAQPEPGLYVIQAFGGHGVATAHALADVLAEHLVVGTALPAAFARYPLNWAGGQLGRLAAEARYRWLIWLDQQRE